MRKREWSGRKFLSSALSSRRQTSAGDSTAAVATFPNWIHMSSYTHDPTVPVYCCSAVTQTALWDPPTTLPGHPLGRKMSRQAAMEDQLGRQGGQGSTFHFEKFCLPPRCSYLLLPGVVQELVISAINCPHLALLSRTIWMKWITIDEHILHLPNYFQKLLF